MSLIRFFSRNRSAAVLLLLLGTACGDPRPATISRTGIAAEAFADTLDGRPTALYVLRNSRGMEATVTNYGARIVSLTVPDAAGRFDDIVCGFDSLAPYVRWRPNFGATVGRYIGRILGARFTLDSVEYRLDGKTHCSHGGKPGFANRVWEVLHHAHDRLELRYLSPDGESGFPGELDLRLTMRLTEEDELVLDYRATTSKPTVLNPSNHSFFNLSGDFSQEIGAQELRIDGDSIAEYDASKCVTGRLLAVDGSPFDFRLAHPIGERIDADNAQLRVTGGYDHVWQLNPSRGDRPAATLHDPRSGRTMEVYTTEPALQIYTANGLKANMRGKYGLRYARRTALCFETMHFPDSPNQPQFSSTVLRPGEEFRSTTRFRFIAESDPAR